jgi:hypothetical protein
MTLSSSRHEGTIVTILGEACARVLGPGRVAVLGDLDVSSKRSVFNDRILPLLPALWFYFLLQPYWSRRGAAEAERRGPDQAQPTAS